jgi:cytochrome c-type biogenesis protein CcmH/NrfF
MYVPLERDVDSISSGFTELSAQLHCLKCQTEF